MQEILYRYIEISIFLYSIFLGNAISLSILRDVILCLERYVLAEGIRERISRFKWGSVDSWRTKKKVIE